MATQGIIFSKKSAAAAPGTNKEKDFQMILRKTLATSGVLICMGLKLLAGESTNDFPYFTGDIYPTPQKAEYLDEFINIYSPEKNSATSCILISKDLKKDDARVLELVEKIQVLGGKIDIKTDDENTDNYSNIISIGKTKYRNKNKVEVPQRQEGYIISFIKEDGKEIAILDSYDEQGLYWSISSLCQLLTKSGNNVVLKKAKITDYPEYKVRCAGTRIHGGFIPFFYTLSKELPKRYKYNTILPATGGYWAHMLQTGDKKLADDYWRDSYADSAFDKLKETAAYFNARKVDLIPQMSPHVCKKKIQFSSVQDIDALQNFIRQVLKAGCSGVSVWLDDVGLPISEEDAKIFKNGGSAHAFLFRNIQEMMKKEYPGRKFNICPTLYMSNAQREVDRFKFNVVPSEYWNILREELAPEVTSLWNGPHVCSCRVTSEQANRMTRILDKKLLFCDFGWCGANKLEHYRFDPIPYESRFSPDFYDHVGGYMLPVWLSPEREIFYAQVGDFLWNPRAFNAERSLKKAIEKVIGPDFYPLAVKYRNAISKFDFTGFKATPAAIKETETLEANYKELEEIFDEIVKSKPDKNIVNALEIQMSDIRKFLKTLKNTQTNMKEHETVLNTCIQKEIGNTPDDIVLLSTQFFSAGSGVLKDNCEPRYAAVVYGPEAKSTMYIKFTLDDRDLDKSEKIKMLICGQDDEEDEECKIAIILNGNCIFKGSSGFTRSGWSLKEFTIPASYLKRGENVFEIKNTTKSENQYGAPWFAVNYAVIRPVLQNDARKSDGQ